MIKSDVWWDLASFILRTILTSIAAIILVLEANGYLIDFNRLRIEKAGLLVMTIHPTNASVFLGTEQLIASGSKITDKLFPDQYVVEVRLNGYQTWRHIFRIEPGSVEPSSFPDVVLFPLKIVKKSSHISTYNELQMNLFDKTFSVVNNELWRQSGNGDQLITRLSENIQAAIYFDDYHIIYETESGIHVIDADGTNDVSLVAEALSQPAPVYLSDNGHILNVVMSQVTEQYQIQ
jgi:hypothetical protein